MKIETIEQTFDKFLEWLIIGIPNTTDHPDVYCMNLLLFKKWELFNILIEILIIVGFIVMVKPYSATKAFMRFIGNDE